MAHSIGFLFDRTDLIQKMGAAGRNQVRANHDPDRHIEKMMDLYGRLVSTKKVLSFPTLPDRTPPRPRVRVAFIGGRGVVSKYSGIESFYEEAGHELAKL